MKSHLITLEEVSTIGRPIGNVDKKKLDAYITEVEQMYIKPTLGEALFYSLLSDENDENEDYVMLLQGGAYSDSSGAMKTFQGLKKAVAYYVYAQNVMSGDYVSTRFGMVTKDGDFSTRISSKERSDHYNNSYEVALFYLKECVAYCKSAGLITSRSNGAYTTGGCTIRKIG